MLSLTVFADSSSFFHTIPEQPVEGEDVTVVFEYDYVSTGMGNFDMTVLGISDKSLFVTAWSTNRCIRAMEYTPQPLWLKQEFKFEKLPKGNYTLDLAVTLFDENCESGGGAPIERGVKNFSYSFSVIEAPLPPVPDPKCVAKIFRVVNASGNCLVLYNFCEILPGSRILGEDENCPEKAVEPEVLIPPNVIIPVDLNEDDTNNQTISLDINGQTASSDLNGQAIASEIKPLIQPITNKGNDANVIDQNAKPVIKKNKPISRKSVVNKNLGNVKICTIDYNGDKQCGQSEIADINSDVSNGLTVSNATYFLTISKRQENKIIIDSNGLEFQTVEKIQLDENGLRVAGVPIILLSMEKINEIERQNGSLSKIELKLVNEIPKYEIKTMQKTKLLWIVPVEMEVKTTVNAQNGVIESIEVPWWSFLAGE